LLSCCSLCSGTLLRLLRSRRLLPCGRISRGSLLRLLARRGFRGAALL
jgi:hypothetical protein